MDIYISRSVGSYFVKPKWSSTYHKGKTSLDVYKIFSKEELKRIGPDGIGKKVLPALSFDTYLEEDERK